MAMVTKHALNQLFTSYAFGIILELSWALSGLCRIKFNGNAAIYTPVSSSPTLTYKIFHKSHERSSMIASI